MVLLQAIEDGKEPEIPSPPTLSAANSGCATVTELLPVKKGISGYDCRSPHPRLKLARNARAPLFAKATAKTVANYTIFRCLAAQGAYTTLTLACKEYM
jgi:hypothetical protein|tara:strand:- start:49 stop:345 length:297 start_codon:yes stop_codon:yes gene_type:complete